MQNFTPADSKYYKMLSPFIRDYIYRAGWGQLRDIQTSAIEAIMNTESHLLLSSGTASGKTEAAFLPCLTKITEDPPRSVGILYISPLKALINDQFERLSDLLDEAKINVVKWHGDASVSRKNALISNPSGVMQTTPESIEGLLVLKREACTRLFSDLRFIIIDEVHYFMDSVRGLQLQSQLERIERLCGVSPRRIGLSATISDYSGAEAFLAGNTGVPVITPQNTEPPRKIRLFCERFVMRDLASIKVEQLVDDIDYYKITEFLYQKTKGKKSIIFCNSRAETEVYTARLKAYAKEHNLPDVYKIHHGSLSKEIRENAERVMKTSEIPAVTAATVTLELGIDLGSLDRILQIGSPFSASSFVQRLGRSGRTAGKIPEMVFALIENEKTEYISAADEIDWQMLLLIAIIELYTKERFVEPIRPDRFNYSLLYHQTMSILASAGTLKAAVLASTVLTLPPFREIPKEDYELLLRHLIDIGHLSKDDRGCLQIGYKAEPVVSSYKFYSVFTTEEEFTVKYKGEVIGTVSIMFSPGLSFALAGKSWIVDKCNEKEKILYVKPLEASARIMWIADQKIIFDRRVMEKIRDVLNSDDDYPYLSLPCKERLARIRETARHSGIATETVVKTGADKYAVFPWLGTREMYTLMYAMNVVDNDLKFYPKRGMYAEVTYSGSAASLERLIKQARSRTPELRELSVYGALSKEARAEFLDPIPKEAEIPGKFNAYIPKQLLRKQFLEDFCVLDGFSA
ncbi:MAG: DEAD/DEAH box helicase [Ruminococcus sp.]|jgi:ATP-dependent Lhr-like helicase|nr:DEAD/DEAH box helicase [Ruminococcus sp.]